MRDVWAGMCKGELAVCRSVCLSVEAQPKLWPQHTVASPAPGAHPGSRECGGESARGCVPAGAPRAASSPRFANFRAHPEPSLLPVADTGGSEGGGSQRGDGLMGGGHASVTYRGAWGPWRPREPSRRRGAAALPSLVHLGRRPQRQSRWAAATPAEPPGGAGGTGGAGWRPGRCRRRRSPGVRIAPGPLCERTPRARSPAPARHSPPLNYLRLGIRGGEGGLLRVALSPSPSGEGKFLPVDFLFRNAKDQ